VLLLAVGLVWTMVVWVSPVRSSPQTAAHAFATGQVAMQTATDAAGFHQAVVDFQRATELRPTFGRAWVGLAYARFREGSPVTSGTASFTSPPALEDAVRYFRRAVSLGVDDFWVQWNLGFDLYLLGLKEGRSDLIEQGIDATRVAIGARDRLFEGKVAGATEPALRYNLGLALLADGQIDAARSVYRKAIEETMETVPGGASTNRATAGEQRIVGAAITDLQFLADTRPDLDQVIREIKGEIVGTVAAGQEEPASPGSSPTVDFLPSPFAPKGLPQFDPNGIIWGPARVEGGVPEGTPVSVEWYFRGWRSSGWEVMPSASILGMNQDELASTTLRSVLFADHRCLPPGTYRQEVYVGTRLAALRIASTGTEPEPERKVYGSWKALLAPSLNMEFCYPSGWSRVHHSDVLEGTAEGAESADGTAGAYVIRANLALPPHTKLHWYDWRATLQLAERVLRRSNGLFPAPLEACHPTCYGYAAGSYFMSGTLMAQAGHNYRYDGGNGTVWMNAGIGRDGGLLIGVVFGPAPGFRENVKPDHILNSMEVYDSSGI
jgi:hypothetical protein